MRDPGPEAKFRAALREGRLLIQRCAACGCHIFPPRLVCLHCAADDLVFVQPSGGGTVYSVTIVRCRRAEDYNVVRVDLGEGVRVMSRMVGIDPGNVRIGMHVRGFVGAIDGQPAPLFRPDAGEGS